MHFIKMFANRSCFKIIPIYRLFTRIKLTDWLEKGPYTLVTFRKGTFSMEKEIEFKTLIKHFFLCRGRKFLTINKLHWPEMERKKEREREKRPFRKREFCCDCPYGKKRFFFLFSRLRIKSCEKKSTVWKLQPTNETNKAQYSTCIIRTRTRTYMLKVNELNCFVSFHVCYIDFD